MSGPEHGVKQDCKAILDTFGAWHFMPVPTGYGRRGIPDIIACVPRIITLADVGRRLGLFAGLECKALDDMEPTKWQIKELTAIDEAGGLTSGLARGLGAPSHKENLRKLLDAK